MFRRKDSSISPGFDGEDQPDAEAGGSGARWNAPTSEMMPPRATPPVSASLGTAYNRGDETDSDSDDYNDDDDSGSGWEGLREDPESAPHLPGLTERLSSGMYYADSEGAPSSSPSAPDLRPAREFRSDPASAPVGELNPFSHLRKMWAVPLILILAACVFLAVQLLNLGAVPIKASTEGGSCYTIARNKPVSKEEGVTPSTGENMGMGTGGRDPPEGYATPLPQGDSGVFSPPPHVRGDCASHTASAQ